MPITRTNTLNNYEYNPARTLDFFNQPEPHYIKDYAPFKGEIGEEKYSELLDDYMDSVIRDFNKFSRDVERTAIEWNCSTQLMKNKLHKWGVIKMYKNVKIELTDDEIIKTYYSCKSISATAGKLKVSHHFVRSKLRKLKIEIFNPCVNSSYEEIKKSKKKQLELVEYYKQHGIVLTSGKYKMSASLVTRILAKYGVCGHYKKNHNRGVSKRFNFIQGELGL